MPLNKTKLKNAIQSSLDKAASDFENGDENAFNPAIISDHVVQQMHDELETKVDQLAKTQIEIIQAVIVGLSSITPPGQGTVGATAFQQRTTQVITKLNKIQADVKKYKE